MKAFILLSLLLTISCIELEDAVVIIHSDAMTNAIANTVKLTPYFSYVFESFMKGDYKTTFEVGMEIIKQGVPLIREYTNAITYKPENVSKDLRGDININIGTINLPCINICIDFTFSGKFRCHCG